MYIMYGKLYSVTIQVILKQCLDRHFVQDLLHTVKPRPEAHMDMILFEVFLKNIDLIPQQQILQMGRGGLFIS